MNNVSHEAYRQKLQEIAAEYEARGYDVLVEPRPEQLPEFLAGFRPDLVARGPNESVVVEVKVGTQTQQLLDRQAIVDRLGRANELLKTGATDAAFLLMWVAVEALLRHIATREGLPLERVPSSSLMKELFSLGILSRSELEVAQRAFSVRNALVHGFATTRLDETSRELAQFAQKLLLELDRSQE
jgi:uncharacterized protein YutE (UPF0331/DUF86 family)